MTTLALIAAVASNGVIGRNNTLPWRLPDDLAHFKHLTLGSPILMGRKTWESLGRPLPGRRNLVITRNPAYVAEGGECHPGLEAAMAACASAEKVFLIGGADLYRQAIDRADALYITEVHTDVQGDAFFPSMPAGRFLESARTSHPADERHAYAFDFVTYYRHP